MVSASHAIDRLSASAGRIWSLNPPMINTGMRKGSNDKIQMAASMDVGNSSVKNSFLGDMCWSRICKCALHCQFRLFFACHNLVHLKIKHI